MDRLPPYSHHYLASYLWYKSENVQLWSPVNYISFSETAMGLGLAIILVESQGSPASYDILN